MAAANLARAALGDRGQTLLAALILVSCAGGAMSSLLTGSRIFVPLATDGLFIRWLGWVAPSTGVPARAVIVSALLGISYVLIRSFEQLTEAFVVGFFPFYMLVVAAVYVLRRREPDQPRPFRVPGYPVVPALFLAGATALLVGAVQGADRVALFALGVVALGLPVQAVSRALRRR
jgi:amino acid transporter